MEIFNIGPLELLFIVLIALVVLGPEESIKTLRQMGRGIYRLTHSSFWSSVMDTSREISELPKTIVREAGLEESIREIKKSALEVENNVREALEEIPAGGDKTKLSDWDPVEAVREKYSTQSIGNTPTDKPQDKTNP